MTLNHLSPPTDRLHAAAELLRAVAGDIPRTEPWGYYPTTIHTEYEGHIASDGDPQWSGICDVIVGTSAGPYIVTMQPAVGLALAKWLDDAAREATEIGPNPWAVTVADTLLGIPAAKAPAEQAVTG